MKKSDVTRNTRLAGLVRRYHTWPTLHNQTIAEHSWQVMRLYIEIFGLPRSEVFLHILWHDVGEIQTGDIPYPVKAKNKELKIEMDRLDEEARESMGERVFLPTLTDEEHTRFKFCDLLDCAEQGQYERNLGNQYMGTVADQSYGLKMIVDRMGVRDAVAAKAYCASKYIVV